MQIETKFNIGDKLWFIDGTGKLLEVTIQTMDIKVTNIHVNSRNSNKDFETKIAIEHRIRPTSESSYTFTGITENKLYKTKQEAGEAWMKSQGLKCGVSLAD